MTLIWATPDIGTTPITYEIRRDTEAAFLSPETLAAANTTTSYSDTGPTGGFIAGRTYYYRVTPENSVGTGPMRAISVTIRVPDPPIPTGGDEIPEPGGP